MSVKHPLFQAISIAVALAILLTATQAQVWAFSGGGNHQLAGSDSLAALGGNTVLSDVFNDFPTSPALSTEQAEPTALSLSRVQSEVELSAVMSNTITVTLTVRNALPPCIVPEIPSGATLTDTVDALTNFDFSDDPNSLTNVILVDTFDVDAIISDLSPNADIDGETFVWNIGDLNPLQSASVTFSLELPAGIAGFAPRNIYPNGVNGCPPPAHFIAIAILKHFIFRLGAFMKKSHAFSSIFK